MRSILLLFFIAFSIQGLFSQSSNDYDRILKTESLPFHNYELRVYKKTAISTGLEMFRFYQDSTKNWKAEWFETIVSKDQPEQIHIRNSKLNSYRNPELIWIQILNTDVLHLPAWEKFQYKLEKKNKEVIMEDGEFFSSVSKSTILDGVSYLVEIRCHQKENTFSYHNPESYVKIYPTVDELLSFKELLHLLRNDFKVFQKK
ncbi:MAG: hypothetical protein LBE92_19095 [Chryseobacterium sp.]|jgi:hypothetical protein|uniref:hypothetical protein n=1 Tax=Chryseobacterium sp. TaxID=1871047 RepID=UPI00282794F3|nr:hypothetical protein [Chryseobacterium sp.]MDR2238237.1 hypothetical protein [Chryseobacterium sp.]